MKEAFNFMFKDNMFKQKALTVFVFLFIANIFTNIAKIMAPARGEMPSANYAIFVILGILFSFITGGYGITCIKSFIGRGENIILPFMNIKNNFVLGIKQFIAVVIATFVILIGFIAAGMIISLLLRIINLYGIGIIISNILAIAVILVIIYYLMALSYIFATTEKLTSFLQFKKAHEMIKPYGKHYLLTLLLIILIAVCIGTINTMIIGLFAKIGIPGIVLSTAIMSIIGVYFIYVYSYLVAKSL